jgi:RAT1-interacting protein
MSRKRLITEVEGVEHTEQEGVARAAARPRRTSPPTLPDGQRLLEMPSKDWSPKPVAFQKPFQLISFSYTSERRLVFDDSALKFWVEPPRGADLSHRYEHWIKRKETKGRLDGLLQAINEEACKGAKSRAHVVCWRGVLCRCVRSVVLSINLTLS